MKALHTNGFSPKAILFKIQKDNNTNVKIYVDFMEITIVQNSFIIIANSKRNGCYSNKRIKVQYKTKQNVPSRILFVYISN